MIDLEYDMIKKEKRTKWEEKYIIVSYEWWKSVV